jgi:hypothetical protein
MITGLLITSCGSTGLKVSEKYHLIKMKARGRVSVSISLYNDTGRDLKLISYSKP